ncbi:hypothetical protein NERG_01486 [Nematocida ausubeli]|uniref:RanBD1 domain-containing protein n=1 Tax=Nematocida ausubeli (strain ATCC PRA-371 / ERTm2) TaxID=1913371 RepID=H8ZCP3_NEMA1|nr:hypothetical protein NERG_01486 [Nematocida ausubeli]
MEAKEHKEEIHAQDPIPETEEEQIRRRREEYTKLSEKDDIIFSASAILYRFQIETKSWVGRGKGKLRVSLEPTSKKYRITQIREKVFKLGCNHYIEKETVLTKYSLAEHSWMWTTFGDDCGDGLDKTQKLLTRFTTAEDAEKFFAAVEKGRAQAEKPKEEREGPAEKKAEPTEEVKKDKEESQDGDKPSKPETKAQDDAPKAEEKEDAKKD